VGGLADVETFHAVGYRKTIEAKQKGTEKDCFWSSSRPFVGVGAQSLGAFREVAKSGF